MKKGWIEGFFVDCQSPTISITVHPIHRWVNEEKVCQVCQYYYARLHSLKFMYIHTVGRSLAWEGKSDLCQLMYPHMALQDVKFQHPEKKKLNLHICLWTYEKILLQSWEDILFHDHFEEIMLTCSFPHRSTKLRRRSIRIWKASSVPFP